MGRSKWKGPFTKLKQKNNQTFVSRDTVIIPKFVGLAFQVHNGLKHKEVLVNEEMLGHKFGEFFFTRAKYIFKKKKRKKK